MKKRCPEREEIFALAQGMTSERDSSEVMAHVNQCGGCRAMFESYRRLDDVLDHWNPAAEPSPWFDARVRAAARESAGAARGFFGLDLNRWLALPVLASLLLVAGVVTFRRPARVVAPHVQAPVATHVSISPAQATNQTPPPPPQSGAQEVNMYQNLSVLEDYDMLAGFDVISELPKGHKVAD
jgi:hypothetical protein